MQAPAIALGVSRKPWLMPALSVGAALSATAWVAVVDPNRSGNYPSCPFLATTSCFCPGCGSLRMVHALTRGDLVGAAGHNVLTLLMLPVLVWLWWRWAAARMTGRPDVAPMAGPIWGLLAVIITFGVVRNLPFGAWLAP